jgi:hypothetical protein
MLRFTSRCNLSSRNAYAILMIMNLRRQTKGLPMFQKRREPKKQPILEYEDEHGVRKELPPEMTPWYLCYVGSDLFAGRIAEKLKSSAAASACRTINTWSL